MSFANRSFSVIAYANGFTWWHYKSKDGNITEIITDGFFDNVKTLINNGDIVSINAIDGTCQAVFNFDKNKNLKVLVMSSVKYEEK